MGKIFVGADGSDLSRAAITWAAKRAVKTHDTLTLVYVVDDSFQSVSPAMFVDLQDAGNKLLEQEVAYAKQQVPNVDVEYRIMAGNPSVTLEKMSEEADLIAIGAHHGTQAGAAILGTKAIRIAAGAKCPVAVVPADDPQKERKPGVVVGVDQEQSSSPALQYAAMEASKTDQPLICVYAWQPPATPGVEFLWGQEIEKALREEADRVLAIATAGISEQYPDLTVERRVVQGSPVSVLTEAAKDATLLVVGNRGHKGIARLLLGSVSHGVLNHLPSPVIVARNDA